MRRDTSTVATSSASLSQPIGSQWFPISFFLWWRRFLPFDNVEWSEIDSFIRLGSSWTSLDLGGAGLLFLTSNSLCCRFPWLWASRLLGSWSALLVSAAICWTTCGSWTLNSASNLPWMGPLPPPNLPPTLYFFFAPGMNSYAQSKPSVQSSWTLPRTLFPWLVDK